MFIPKINVPFPVRGRVRVGVIFFVFLLGISSSHAFELEAPVVPQYHDFNDILRQGEAGDLKKEDTLPAVWFLFHQDYEAARNAARTSPASYPEWFSSYVKT